MAKAYHRTMTIDTHDTQNNTKKLTFLFQKIRKSLTTCLKGVSNSKLICFAPMWLTFGLSFAVAATACGLDCN